MNDVVAKIRQKLFLMQDLKYKDFHSKLMPTVDSESVIGIKVPVLRKLAKELNSELSENELNLFLQELPHKYYEENNLHGFIIEQINDYDKCVKSLDYFLPYVNNWATCDSISPKCFKSKKNRAELRKQSLKWIESPNTYVVRFGIGQLMKYFLDDYFSPTLLEIVANVKSEEYYINMMRAWYFATALAKQYEATFPFISERKLDVWTLNKTIQKAVESYRVPEERKKQLRNFFIK